MLRCSHSKNGAFSCKVTENNGEAACNLAKPGHSWKSVKNSVTGDKAVIRCMDVEEKETKVKCGYKVESKFFAMVTFHYYSACKIERVVEEEI